MELDIILRHRFDKGLKASKFLYDIVDQGHRANGDCSIMP
jgi:hypothetical protein